ncbi:Mitochondrial ATPase complex subunit atp10 [Stygiomarasmius scandens]|uniref:Mitochondrial ATPase complex subunit atp10 n=1 Tax=Marasmiellus scandens TaxID=2682957 RepID=A0ABR1IPG2_9AGAR
MLTRQLGRRLARSNGSEYLIPFRRCMATSPKAKPTESLPSNPKEPKPKATYSKTSAKDPQSEIPDLDGLSFLSRPLGVRERPSSKPKTRRETVKEMLTDEQAIGKERRFLVKEAVTRGYFHDLNATRHHGGKTWIAPKVLIREDKALYLPDIAGKALSDGEQKHTTSLCMGKISILSMLNSRISEFHSSGFTELTHARFSPNPLYQHIHINLQENLLKSMLVNLFLSSLRSSVPLELHPTYLVSSQNMEYERDALGMTNNRVGYVYLIDENLRIRWAGCADATLEEAQALEVCTGVLLKRLEKKVENEKRQVEGNEDAEVKVEETSTA